MKPFYMHQYNVLSHNSLVNVQRFQVLQCEPGTTTSFRAQNYRMMILNQPTGIERERKLTRVMKLHYEAVRED